MSETNRNRPSRLRGLGLATIMAIGLGPLISRPVAAETCIDELLRAEEEFGIPGGLLLAIALVETGRDGTPRAFAMNIGGQTVLPENGRTARNLLRNRNGEVKSSVYAGCLQISVDLHGGNFRPIEQIVDPEANARYGATLLRRLRAMSGSWPRAVARYQGGNSSQQRNYVCEVWRRLDALDSRATAELFNNPCTQTRTVAIAPETRRAFRQAQVALLSK